MTMSEFPGNYQVSIRPEGGMYKEHAEAIKKKLEREGWNSEAVSVEPIRVEVTNPSN